MTNHKRVLVLNADYTPLGLVSWRRAIVLSILNQDNPEDGVVVVDYYKDDYITSGHGRRHPVPAVVAVPKYVRQHRRKVPFSRKNVFIRDQMTCQYCGYCDGTTDLLTYDHVIPRSVWKKKGYEGTPTHWKNIVTCCIDCNRKKADKTPEQAGMPLLREVQEPNPRQFILGLTPWSKVPQEWEIYLTPIYKQMIKNREKNGLA